MDCGKALDVFYQSVRGLKKKSVEIFKNVCLLNFKIVCLWKRG
jgi:hypothetical protein